MDGFRIDGSYWKETRPTAGAKYWKFKNLHIIVSLFKGYTIFLPYITMFIIVNFVLLLVKTIQIWSVYNTIWFVEL